MSALFPVTSRQRDHRGNNQPSSSTASPPPHLIYTPSPLLAPTPTSPTFPVQEQAAVVIVASNENRASHNRNDVNKARRDLNAAVAGFDSAVHPAFERQSSTEFWSLPAAAHVEPPEWRRLQTQGAVLFHGADLSTDLCTPVVVVSDLPCPVTMGGGSSKHGYKHKDKKRHSKSGNNAAGGGSAHKIMVQQAATVQALGSAHNENHHNALSDSPRPLIAETLQAKPGVDFSKFKVIKLKAAIDKKPTTIDEKSNAVLKYRTPHFRALATVEVPVLEENQSVQVGWIQTCTEMRFVNTYSDEGVTSWEFPEIVSGKFQMIGDADGKQYPWYGSKNELTCVTGPTKEPTPVTVHMNDNFFPQVTWYIPDGAYDKTPRLTHIHRAQRFYTYLVAQDLSGGQRYHILRVVEWAMELHIDVNPHNPLGKRAKLLGPMDQAQPRTIPSNLVPLQPYALKPPNANNAQTLVWRPFKGEPKIIVPPIETTMDMEKYIVATRSLDMSRAGNAGGRL